jgi:putative salt-induced outer membrane protein YdiY
MIPAYVVLTALVPQPAAAPAPALATSPLSAFVTEDAPAPAEVKWTGSIAAGATLQTGNTDSRAANVDAQAERRGAKDRWTAKGWWNYGENKVDGDWVLNSRKAGANLKYDYFLSKKVYVNGVAGVETDTFADLELRLYAGAGLGYQWTETDTFKWGSEAGVTYFSDTHWVQEDDDYPAGRLANNIDWKITDKTSFANYLELYPSLEYGEDVHGRSDTRLKTSLTEKMFAQLQWVWDYDNTPAAGADRNDHRVTLGLGWSF